MISIICTWPIFVGPQRGYLSHNAVCVSITSCAELTSVLSTSASQIASSVIYLHFPALNCMSDQEKHPCIRAMCRQVRFVQINFCFVKIG